MFLYMFLLFVYTIYIYSGLAWEFKASAPMVTSVSISSFILCTIWWILYATGTDHGEFGTDWLVTILIIIWRIKMFWVNMTQTYRVLRKFGLLGADADNNIYLLNNEYHSRKLVRNKTLEHLKNNQELQMSNASLPMKDVLIECQAFDLFVGHCGNEHCLECVLSVIEFIQFKKRLFAVINEPNDGGGDGDNDNEAEEEENTNLNDKQGDEEEDVTERFLILPETCPVSEIIHGGNMDNFKTMARELYLRYIKTGSEWEINISYMQRLKYERLMDDDNVWLNDNKDYDDLYKLYVLYDYCIQEMVSLLRSAFSRFKQDDKFLLLQKQKHLLPANSAHDDENNS